MVDSAIVTTWGIIYLMLYSIVGVAALSFKHNVVAQKFVTLVLPVPIFILYYWNNPFTWVISAGFIGICIHLCTKCPTV